MLSMKRLLFIILFFSGSIFPAAVIAQTGPAGVGSAATNIVWLKADAGTSTTVSGNTITQWNDQSGNGNNVSQSTVAWRPLYRSSVAGALNGMPAIEFDNDAANYDYMTCPDNATLDNYTSMTSFGVFRLNTGTPSGTPRALMSKRVDPGTQNDFGWFHYTSNNIFLDVNGNSYRMNTSTTYSTGTDYLVGFTFNGALAGNEQKMYNGNTLNVQSNNPGANVPNYASDFHVGVLYGHTGASKQFNGYIPELIVYNTEVNPAQFIIVNNYLSAKYDVALAASDFYSGDTPANGNFDREVAGIGQSTAGNTNNAFATSICAGMGITYSSGFNDGDYILAGHNLAANTNFYSDVAVVSGGPVQARWQRIWYIDVTNSGSAMSASVRFDLSDGGFTGTAGLASNYKLLYRSTNSGNWTIVATASSTAGDVITFSNISFNNAQDGYYTIGTLDAMNGTLPVEWLSFTANAQGSNALLEWATATESNSDYFSIERINENGMFMPVGTVPAAGNSSMIRTYRFTDEHLTAGVHYYRIRQVDFDGVFSFSSVAAVYINEDGPALRAFPNPAAFGITVQIGDAWTEEQSILTVIDAQGQIVQRIPVTQSRIGMELNPGVYLLQLINGDYVSDVTRIVITGM